VSDELDKQKDSEKRRQARMKTFERNIAQMQHTLDNPPELDDPAAINEELVCPSYLFHNAFVSV
jgi:hypothetical protein